MDPRTITQSQKCDAILHHYIVYVWQTQIVDTIAHVVEDRLKTLITWRFSRTHGITPASSKFLNRLRNKSFSILRSTTCPIGARQRCISQAFHECFCFDWLRKRIVFKCTQLLYLQIGIQVWYVREVTLRSQRFQTSSLFLLNSSFICGPSTCHSWTYIVGVRNIVPVIPLCICGPPLAIVGHL